jgi:hypothetical protein
MTTYKLTIIEADTRWVVKGQVPRQINNQSDTRDLKLLRNGLQVFKNLPEPETLHRVDSCRALGVDIIESTECTIGTEVLVETVDRVYCTVQVLGVACDTPCIKIGLQNLWTKYVNPRCDVEAILSVEA